MKVRLSRQDREVNVESGLSNLLYFLAKNAHQVFTREALIMSAWKGATVIDQAVTQSIFELRKLLTDEREEYLCCVITVPKRGYKLVADVSLMTTSELRACRFYEYGHIKVS